MNTFPSVKIAMFGSRSTGKTNFLASFIGVDSTQGCSIDFNNAETRKMLHKNWKCLLQGDVPQATAMTDEKPLIFNLRRRVKEQARDEWGWNVTMKDYPGKLMEEDENSDEISAAIKLKLDAHIQEADAILFLAPVEIREWEPAQQQLYVAYIKNCVSIAKEYREKHGRSIPFCLALMKWDQTGLPSTPSSIDEKGIHENSPEVTQFLKDNEIFSRIYTVIQDLSNQDVAVFATSSYGSHNPENKNRPDPNNLRPFNVIQILHWLCTSVENVRLETLKREINALSAEAEADDTYDKMEKLYSNYLSGGINDYIIEKEIQQRAKDLHEKHTAFFEKKFQEQMDIIDKDSKSSNPWAEKVHWYRDKLERKLYHEDDERELKYELADLEVKARKRAKWILSMRVLGIVSTLLFIAFVGGALYLGSRVSANSASYAQGESILQKEDKNLTYEDFRKADPYFAIRECPMENSWPWLKGRREKYFARKNAFIKETRSELDKKLEAIPVEGTNQEKTLGLNKKIRLIQDYRNNGKIDPERFSDMMKELESELAYCEKAQKLDAHISTIRGADISKRLIEIENLKKEFVRTDFHSSELDLFAQVDDLRQSTIDELDKKMKEELSLVSDEGIDVENFIELEKRASERAAIYNKYYAYYPEGDSAADLKQKADDAVKQAKNLAKYSELQAHINTIRGTDITKRLIEIVNLEEEFVRADYHSLEPDLFAQVDSIRQATIEELDMKMKEELALVSDESVEAENYIELQKRASERAAIYNKYYAYYPEGEFAASLKKKADEAGKIVEKLSKYSKLQEMCNQIAASPFEEKRAKAEQFLKDYKIEDYPEAGSIFNKIEDVIQDVNTKIKDQMTTELNGIEDDPNKSLSVRYANTQKRKEIYEKYQAKFQSGTERTQIDNLIDNEMNLLTDLDNWKKFEDAFMTLKAALNSSDESTNSKIAKCSEFTSNYSKKDYQGYPNYQIDMNDIAQTQGHLENLEKIENVCQEFDDFEKNFNNNSEQYSKIATQITTLKGKLSLYGDENQITVRLTKLKDMATKNEKNWEDSEYDKVQSKISTLKASPSEDNVDSALTAVNDYLFAQDTPKTHADEMRQNKEFLEKVKGVNNITVTLKMYKVKDTKFDGWGTQVTTFAFGNSPLLISNNAGEDATYPNKSVTGKDTCTSSWPVGATYPRTGASGATTVNVLSRVINGQSLTYDITIGGMPVQFSISGYPTAPFGF